MRSIRRLAAVLAVAPLLSGAGAPPPSRIAGAEAALGLAVEPPQPDGTVRAALLVDLAPGWKTYWLDPGDAGIPPEIDASASSNLVPVSAGFPVPHRFGDAAGSSNGFSQPMAVALLFRTPDPAAPATVDVSVTLGLCREVCVPVIARLSKPVDAADAADARLVASAFDALPTPSTAEAGIASATLSANGTMLDVVATAAPGEETRAADLFVAGPKGWFFGAPRPPERDGRQLRFAVPVAEHPRGERIPPAIEAVLVLGASAYGASALPVAPAP